MQGLADVAAEGLDEGVAHAAADDEVVHLADEVLQDRELGGDLGAADDGGQRALGVLQDVVDGLDLAFHQVAEHLVVREVLGDEGGGAVGAVGRAESVVHIAVSVGGELLDEGLLGLLDGLLGGLLLVLGGILGKAARLAFFLGVEAEVLQEEGLTRLQGRGLLVRLLAVGGELDGNAQALGHVVHDVLQGELRIHLLGTSEVGHDDDGAALLEDLLEGRHGPADAGVVGDVEVLVEGNVEIHPHNRLLSFEIVGFDVLLHNH